ncbi:hypothetical protein N865_11630 [Intrasporangium oryzae NRRL B-24470]|uniref:Cache domain-containing protein n=1 Tax=Intrasporangium oryzae NRRL B-24470 TaxID=1386089 RepID=W9G711_9MICO|nr:cache domain-containing protein [Intrasporangium oryzae]EWT01062.1 hypothetical protein N865_11630 [Intrasporangium oryzae NRRL B-24470]
MTVVTRQEDVARWVADFAHDLFERLDVLAARLADDVSRDAPRRADLRLEQLCRSMLTDPTVPVAGAGAVMAPGVLADAPYWLEWWVVDGASRPTVSKLAAETDTRAIGFRDYTELPWYSRPFESGERHITGPYVDYVCTDQYTLTFTQPVHVAGEFVGIVGADVLVAWFEEHLLEVLDGIEPPCLVVNASGRIVTSSDPAWVTGDLVRGLPLARWLAGDDAPDAPWRATRCDDLPFFAISRR